MGLTLLGAIIISAGLILMFLCGLYYDRKTVGQYEKIRRQTVFVCVRCNHIYSSHAYLKKSPCPHCGHVNIPLRF